MQTTLAAVSAARDDKLWGLCGTYLEDQNHQTTLNVTTKKITTPTTIERLTFVVFRCTFTSGRPELLFSIDMVNLSTAPDVNGANRKSIAANLTAAKAVTHARRLADLHGGARKRAGLRRNSDRSPTHYSFPHSSVHL
jgi:hypothetical protein